MRCAVALSCLRRRGMPARRASMRAKRASRRRASDFHCLPICGKWLYATRRRRRRRRRPRPRRGFLARMRRELRFDPGDLREVCVCVFVCVCESVIQYVMCLEASLSRIHKLMYII